MDVVFDMFCLNVWFPFYLVFIIRFSVQSSATLYVYPKIYHLVRLIKCVAILGVGWNGSVDESKLGRNIVIYQGI